VTTVQISLLVEIPQLHYIFKVSLVCSTSLLSSDRTGLHLCLVLLQIIMDYRACICTVLVLDCKIRHVLGRRII